MCTQPTVGQWSVTIKAGSFAIKDKGAWRDKKSVRHARQWISNKCGQWRVATTGTPYDAEGVTVYDGEAPDDDEVGEVDDHLKQMFV